MTKRADTPEREIQAAIRLALGKDRRCVIWKNSTGVLPAATRTGTRPLAYGLCVGSSDLIGVVKIDGGIVTPGVAIAWADDVVSTGFVHATIVPRNLGRFIALEVKTPVGKPTPEQLRFLALVNSMGGYACIVRSVEDARRAVDAAARGDVAT